MSNDNLRAAITAALRRRDPNADLDVSLTCTPLGAWVSLAGGVIRGPDGAVVDVVARAGDDAKALRGVAFAIGLREAPCPACNGRGRRAYGREVEDGCDECECSGVVVVDPAEEVEQLRVVRAELDAAHDLIAAQAALLTGVANALRGEPSPLASHSHHDLDLRAAGMKRELEATRAAIRAHLHCDECIELATRVHAESANFGCDAHGVGDGWRDTAHAAAVRAAVTR